MWFAETYTAKMYFHHWLGFMVSFGCCVDTSPRRYNWCSLDVLFSLGSVMSLQCQSSRQVCVSLPTFHKINHLLGFVDTDQLIVHGAILCKIDFLLIWTFIVCNAAGGGIIHKLVCFDKIRAPFPSHNVTHHPPLENNVLLLVSTPSKVKPIQQFTWQ